MNGPYSKVHKILKNMGMFLKLPPFFSRNEDPRRSEFQPAGQQLSTLSTGEFYQAGQDASGQQ